MKKLFQERFISRGTDSFRSCFSPSERAQIGLWLTRYTCTAYLFLCGFHAPGLPDRKKKKQLLAPVEVIDDEVKSQTFLLKLKILKFMFHLASFSIRKKMEFYLDLSETRFP